MTYIKIIENKESNASYNEKKFNDISFGIIHERLHIDIKIKTKKEELQRLHTSNIWDLKKSWR